MKKKLLRTILMTAMALTVFMGKGSEAKAYEIVDGQAYMTTDEYSIMEAFGELPDMDIVITDMAEYVGSAAYSRMDYYIPEEIFDYDWYLQKHPELIAMCGTDKKAIYSYYEIVGLDEGWKGRRAYDKLMDLSNFDYARYASDYPDLAAVYGQDASALYTHYITLGIKEGRKGYAVDATTNAYLKIYETSFRILNDNMTDREKVKAVHDWMCLNIAYDYDNYLNDTIPQESYYIEGAMNKGKAVCNGYAETFKHFMDVQGIDCKLISGTANGGGHAWNKVKVDGEYYYIDVTWDDPVPDEPGRIRYDYYLTKDPTFGGDHAPEFD